MQKITLIHKPARSIIGIEGRGLTSEGPQWIFPLWAQAGQRRHEIADSILDEGWGCMSSADEFLAPWGEGEGRYLAGWELKGEQPDIPGWTVWQLPAMTLATLKCNMADYWLALNTLHSLVEQNPKLRQAGATHQCYPPHFTGSPDEEIQVMMMVEEI